MKISPLGDSAIILDFGSEAGDAEQSLRHVLNAAAALEKAEIPGVIEITSSYQSLALFLDLSRVAQSANNQTIAELLNQRIDAALRSGFHSRLAKGRLVEVPICYADEFALDLPRVAAEAGLSHKEVIALHSGAKYICACVGFMPGFPYLAGLPAPIHLPRLDTPRSKVAAGSVAIANGQAGIYPFDAPGGWNLLGRTPLSLFNPGNSPPALITAGDRVRFRAITRLEFDRLCSAQRQAEPPLVTEPHLTASSGIKVISPGFQTTVQDCGRFGFREFGVTTTGALDTATLRLCNLLVGNGECAAGLEIGPGAFRFEFASERLLSWGGDGFVVQLAETSLPLLHCARVPAGAVITMSPKRNGRACIAISGGVHAAPILGSCSTDLRANFGGFNGRVLRQGDELPLGKESSLSKKIMGALASVPFSTWSAPMLQAGQGRPEVLRIVRGRNWDEFPQQTRTSLLESVFRVGMNSDRMGLRLEGAVLESLTQELVSEAVAPGTIQLPRNGLPIVLLADCQTIGGYPKIAHVITVDLARAAQLQPGDEVAFELVTLGRAQELLLAQERDIALFRTGIQARFA